MVWCSHRGLGWFYSAGAGASWTECTATSMAHGGDISPPIRRGGARDVEARRSPGSGHVLEGLGQARRVGEQRAGPIWSTTASLPRRRWSGIEARGGVTALLCGAAAAEARERGRARPGGPGERGNGEHSHGDTAMVVWVEVDDDFAENPLLLLFFLFSSFFLNPEAFLGFIWGT